MATRSMPAHLVAAAAGGELQLGADAVGRRHQKRRLEAGLGQIEEPGETAELGQRRPARAVERTSGPIARTKP